MGQQRHPAWRYNLEAHPDRNIRLFHLTRTETT
jgi:hypothetical protein